jgi:Domain of unknown function (DUF4249)
VCLGILGFKTSEGFKRIIYMKNIIIIGLLALLFTSCQDVIEIDLNEAEQQFVIEGAVTDQPGPYRVSIHKTVPFDQQSVYPSVSGAVVIINNGTVSDTLNEIGDGTYETRFLPQGKPGKTYILTVQAEGQTFTATSTMPDPVRFDTLTQGSGTQPGGGSTILIVPNYNDPVGFGNYYRFVQWNNGVRLPNIFVADDRNSDGIRVARPLFAPGSDIETAIGDSIRVEMQSVDRAIYKYFVALDANSGNGPNASVPANPDNNFGGTCLGYFSAHTVQWRGLVVR